ncbi:MAG: Rrf2 family transcriptional regulator [Candidatus Omnitrophica bacterium]|nr:Rrf2 family transcriptional regulator [Candidatus Omnitrophota bacterium]
MKLITRYTDYAVRALCYIARHQDKKVTVTELVTNLKIPKSFLRKTLQLLNKKGVLKSYKGKFGGFVLALPEDKIYLADLIEIFQGPLKLNECRLKKAICPNINKCLLKKKIDIASRRLLSEIRSINLKSLIK